MSSGKTQGDAVTACFAAATFLGAFLLFLVQPLIAKYILPWFGGGAAVWSTCMLFFQAVLLAGYAYAHLGVSRLGARAQAALHIAMLLGASIAALPAIVPAARWQPSAQSLSTNPTWHILVLLAATVGLPCLALSATSPLLHAWYARLRPGAAVYRLYALSNAGSLFALLAYPLVVEPLLSRSVQAASWSIALAVFTVLCGACAVCASRTGRVPEIAPTGRAPLSVASLILWIALPACASALLLATTNAMTQDLAPVPFLWILPLTLYLLTFIIAFDRPGWYRRPMWAIVLVGAVAGAGWVLMSSNDAVHILVEFGVLSLSLFAGCMVLHGELARLKPPSQQLTTFYLSIAAGGVLGGLLVAVGAPMLLKSYSELPIALWVCCALAFVTPHITQRRMLAGITGLLGLAGVMALAPLLWTASQRKLAGGVLASRSRNFYGVLSVWKIAGDDYDGEGLLLRHGGITHGHQYAHPSLRTTPTTYYHKSSGVGFVLGERSPLPTPRRVGAVGLGAGTIAAYGNAGDVYRFYDINPSVVDLASGPFTYIADMKSRGGICEIALGDGRLSLEREPPQHFDALVLDAFSGDSIPVHLLTKEAFKLYQRHLASSGVLCVHVSNHYLDLQIVVAAAARRLGWTAVMFESKGSGSVEYPARWVILGPDAAGIDRLRQLGPSGAAREKPGFEPWSDEHANVLGVVQ